MVNGSFFLSRGNYPLSLPPSPLTLSVPPIAVPTALPGMDLLKAELLTSGTSPIAHEFVYFGGPSPALFALPLLCPNPTSHSSTGPSGRRVVAVSCAELSSASLWVRQPPMTSPISTWIRSLSGHARAGSRNFFGPESIMATWVMATSGPN